MKNGTLHGHDLLDRDKIANERELLVTHEFGLGMLLPLEL